MEFNDKAWRRAVRDIPFFAREFLGIRPHRGQSRWLRGSDRAENLLVTGNRWGKSFAEAIKIIHHAVFRIRDPKYDRAGKYHIVTASITQDQARIIFDTVIRILNSTCCIEGLIKSQAQTPYPHLVLGNGTVIEARSTQRRGQYLLGHDYDYFVFDEVAFEEEADFVVNEVIKMRLADREGKLDLVSTPNGRNWFYRKMREMKEHPETAYIQNGDTRENRYISKKYLSMQVEYLSEKRVAQNIMGQFVDSGGEIIPGKYIDKALIDEGPASVKWEKTSGGTLINGWDLARKKTATVGITISCKDGICTVLDVVRIRKWDWNAVIASVRKKQIKYPGRLVIDGTGLGDVVESQLTDLRPAPVVFTQKTKAELLTNVELFHSLERIKYARWELPDGPGKIWSLEDELRAATWDDNNRCDALMALGLALWPLRKTDLPAIAPRVGKA